MWPCGSCENHRFREKCRLPYQGETNQRARYSVSNNYILNGARNSENKICGKVEHMLCSRQIFRWPYCSRHDGMKMMLRVHFLTRKGLRRWCMTLRINGFLDFFHRPEFYILENNISATDSVSVLRWRQGDIYSVEPLELISITGPLQHFGNWSCFRPYVREGRHPFRGVPQKETISVTGESTRTLPTLSISVNFTACILLCEATLSWFCHR
jgi:hypothetical protein